MNLIWAAIGVFILALAGTGLLWIVWRRIAEAPRLARLALGFCIGTWLVGVIFFVAYLTSLEFSRWLVLGPVGALAFVGLWAMRPHGPVDGSREKPWLAALLVVLALGISWARPVYGYDAIMMWALKAKMMFFARTWPPTMFDIYTTAHTDYPPLVPSAQAYVFFFLGQFDDVASRVVFAAWFGAGAVILWWLFGKLRVASRSMWVLWWCALPLAMEQVKLTYADLPVAVFCIVFFGAALLWLREPARRDWLWLAAIFGGMAFWVKQDATIGVGAGLAALVLAAIVRKRPWKPIVASILLVALIASPWRAFVWARNLPSDFAFSLAALPAKTILIVKALVHFTNVDSGFALFWGVVLLTLAFRWRKLGQTETAWLLSAFLVAVLGVFAVYWFSTPNLDALLKTSMKRVLLNLYVPALFLVALVWKGRFKIMRWEFELFLAGVIAAIAMFWMGFHRSNPGEAVPFPFVLRWVGVVAILLANLKFWRMARRRGRKVFFRIVQFIIVVDTLGLALVSISFQAGHCGELRREFGGKTLAEQHSTAMEPDLEQKIRKALNTYPADTHVSVLPKRSAWRHRFYYETYPFLVVDSAATNVIQLTKP